MSITTSICQPESGRQATKLKRGCENPQHTQRLEPVRINLVWSLVERWIELRTTCGQFRQHPKRDTGKQNKNNYNKPGGKRGARLHVVLACMRWKVDWFAFWTCGVNIREGWGLRKQSHRAPFTSTMAHNFGLATQPQTSVAALLVSPWCQLSRQKSPTWLCGAHA
jgi:hypothetical protein